MDPQTPQNPAVPPSTPPVPQPVTPPPPPVTVPAPPAAPVSPANTPVASTPPVVGMVPPPPSPPVAGAPTPQISPSPSTPKKSRLGLIIGIVIGVVAVLVVAGFIGGLTIVRQQAKKFSESANSTSINTKVVDSQSTNPCGAKLSDVKPSGKRIIELEDIPKGVVLRNSGDADSTLEYCEVMAVKVAGDKYIDALGSHNWDAAWEMVASTDQAKGKAGRIADWNAELGAYLFSTARYGELTGSASLGHPDYGVEPCRKTYDEGWAKEIKSGHYATPTLNFSQYTLTTIHLTLTKENGAWKIAGENNQLYNSGGVLNGDAYAKSQGDRKYTNPYQCGS